MAVVVVLSVAVVVVVSSSAIASTEAASLAASSGAEHAAKRPISRMDSEKRTGRVCVRTLLGGKKDDGTIPSPPV